MEPVRVERGGRARYLGLSTERLIHGHIYRVAVALPDNPWIALRDERDRTVLVREDQLAPLPAYELCNPEEADPWTTPL